MTARAIIVAIAVVAVALPARAHDGPHAVDVRNNAFEPQLIETDPGDTVTWTVVEGIHTVSGDAPGAFSSGTMDQPGATFSATMPPDDAWVFYHCTVHGTAGEPPGLVKGAGMFGVIKVGDPPAPPISEAEVRYVPSGEWPTLWSAFAGLDDTKRYRIDLAPGTYALEREGARVDLNRSTLALGLPGRPLSPVFELTIRGTGSSPDEVALTGGFTASNITGIGLENLSVVDALDQAILFGAGAEGWSVDRVAIPDAGSFGIRIHRGARRGRIADVAIAGASVAGISIEGCAECDVLIRNSSVRDSLQGISGLNAGTITIMDSTLSTNGVGIALKTSQGEHAPTRGADIIGNTISDSANRALEPPAPSERLDLPVGAGVWLSGTSFATVRQNVIDTSSFGVVVTGPAFGDRIIDNTIDASIEADLGWDGIGTDVCFAGNRRATTVAVSTMPPDAQAIYACDLPMTAGVIYPLVDARVIAWGLGTP